MRLLGAITYDWHGTRRHAVSSDEAAIMVSSAGRDAELVDWRWIRSGWVLLGPRPDHRLSEPTLREEKVCDSADVMSVASAKSHRPFSHRAEVRENTSASESHADEEQKR